MSALALATVPSFAERVTRLLERVDYRRADTAEEREAIFRLRYDAYLREGAITPSINRRFTDRYDDLENAWIFGVYVDGRLASSIRLTVSSLKCPDMPALQVFSDLLMPEIEAGKTIIDPTRFVVDRLSSRTYPELPYVTVWLGWAALEYFHADISLATVRVEHQAFYRRVFGHRPISDARVYPTLEKPISLMALDYPTARDRVHGRYPFFRTTFFTRRMLFERVASVASRLMETGPNLRVANS